MTFSELHISITPVLFRVTHFEGVSTPPEQEQVTADEEQTIKENNRLKQKQQYHKLMAEKCHRIADNSLDEDNQKIYISRATEHSKIADKIGEKITDEPVEKSAESGIINYSYSDKVTKQLRIAFDEEYKSMVDKFGTISTIDMVEPLVSGDSSIYGEFYDHSRTLAIRFADKKKGLTLLSNKAQEMKRAKEWSSSHRNHIIRHEVGHAIQLEHKLNDPLWGEKLAKIIKIMDSVSFEDISKYALSNVDEFISECIAESMTKKSRKTARQVVAIILGGD
ncbi:MAG: hypothetical protein ACI4RL_00725 [Ruminococcus sp.]